MKRALDALLILILLIALSFLLYLNYFQSSNKKDANNHIVQQMEENKTITESKFIIKNALVIGSNITITLKNIGKEPYDSEEISRFKIYLNGENAQVRSLCEGPFNPSNSCEIVIADSSQGKEKEIKVLSPLGLIHQTIIISN